MGGNGVSALVADTGENNKTMPVPLGSVIILSDSNL